MPSGALAARAAAAGRTDALGPSSILRLQRMAGNAGVAQLLDDDPEPESPIKDVVGRGGGTPLEPEAARADGVQLRGRLLGCARAHGQGSRRVRAGGRRARLHRGQRDRPRRRTRAGIPGGRADAGPRADPRRPAAVRRRRGHAGARRDLGQQPERPLRASRRGDGRPGHDDRRERGDVGAAATASIQREDAPEDETGDDVQELAIQREDADIDDEEHLLL